MRVTNYVPLAPLSDFVACFWHYEGYELPHAWERIMPSCEMTLLINLKDNELRWRHLNGNVNRLPGIGICGPQPLPFEIDTAQQRFIMGVEFLIGGAAALLRVPAKELAARHVSLADICGHAATWLHGQLVDASSAQIRFRILEAWLLQRVAKVNASRLLVLQALSLLDHLSVAIVCRKLGIVPKRLIRLFNAEVGLTPKLYSRVRRFERILMDIERTTKVNWAAMGAGHGYYDQAHFAHDFRDFSGYSPAEYLTRRGVDARHVPLLD
jgi:AraC-like DNA-binding protein